MHPSPSRLLRRVLLIALLLFAPAPAAELSAASQPVLTLKDHVYYLAKPALKGRAPNTIGSQRARQYIMDRFEECGLSPWGEQGGFELPFDAGTNVVGLVRGSDSSLRERSILVTAHYDHLGVQDGKVYPGATDNASGVAAVIELARRLTRAESPPRRSVVFIAFDAEEQGLLGAKGFLARSDVDKRKISAVVNIDMLGHEVADGEGMIQLHMNSSGIPRLRKTLQQEAGRQRVRLVPTTIEGMSSDHAVFARRNVPYLFFCCGVCVDLHQPTDTADKLDYDRMARSVNVIEAAVRTLADEPERSRLSTQPATQPAPTDQLEPAPI